MVTLSPIYLTSIPKDKLREFNTRFDMYGDSYTEFLNLRELDYILSDMNYFKENVDVGLARKVVPGGVWLKPRSIRHDD
mgnify:CR=1 FL=1